MKFLEENLLDHLKRPEFRQLNSALVTRSYARNAYICRPDTEENSIFIVSKGRIRVYLGFEDKEFNLAILSRGDIYSSHTGAYVQTLEDAELLVLNVADFCRHMASDGEVNKAMVRVLGNILKASFSIIDGLVFKDASCRLLSLLVTEARRNRASHTGEIILDIDLSVEQIARLVGASRQTISTQLNKLMRKGILQRKERGTFLVPDILALEEEYKTNECL